jgi:hypothetical protein
VLSGLKHRNIVFYYNAWWENNPPPEWEDAAEVGIHEYIKKLPVSYEFTF